jgi:UDP-N-acetylglucosamine acyltransferase
VIDPRAIIDPSVRLGRNVSIGPWTIIGADVEIGEDSVIASHVVMKGPTRLGCRNRVFQFSTIGEDSSDRSYQGEPTTLEIGDDNVFREGVNIHRGTVKDRGRTIIGSHCLLMPYVHIAHDCVIGDHVVFANYAAVSGHVVVGDYSNFGGYAGVAQHRTVGSHTHLAAMSLVIKDVPDYVTVMGNPASVVGLNSEGLRRRGCTEQLIGQLSKAFRTVYRSGLTVAEACAELAPMAAQVPEVATFLAAVADSKFGIVRPRNRRAVTGRPASRG